MTNSINVLHLISQASLVVQLIMAFLLILSIISWVLIFVLSGRLGQALKFDNRFDEWLWSDDLPKQFAIVQSEPHKNGLEQLFFDAYQKYQQQPSNHANSLAITERTLSSALNKQQQELEYGLPLLASIGSVAPYIGLLGTVWGIMNAFIGLSQSASVSLATVAPSIAEALIATALGLFVAIPASASFNILTAKASSIYERRSVFGERLLAQLMSLPTDKSS